jgi:N6-adenosine-specific RNA methylase IME4
MLERLSVEPAPSAARATWAARIAESWRGTVLGILETGRLIIEAKAALPHGVFADMIEHDLPFKRSTAFRLSAIARDERLSNVAHGHHLPPSWRTLYELTKLDDARFEAKLRNGEIYADMSRKEMVSENWLVAKKRDEARVRALEPIEGKFRTLLIDPAWDYDLSLLGRAKPSYACMTLEEMRALDVKGWADESAGCHLYLCVTNNFMPHGCELMKHWGFQHRAKITWIKPPPFGLGSYFRNSTEDILFGTLGDTTTRPAAASIATHFEAPRGEMHSEKPERLYEIVREASYPPYGEAFQRKARPDFVNLFREREAADSPRSGTAIEVQ